MKIKTNLSPSELKLVAKGLSQLSETSVTKPLQPENHAEKMILEDVHTVFDDVFNHLELSLRRIVE